MFRRQFEVFLFEDEPAQDRGAPDIYLAKAGDCDVYVALLGIAYGFEDDEGVSPTEREFDRAVARRRHRLAFVKNISDHYRHPKMVQFIRKVAADLTAELYRSLIKILEDEGVLAARPFDASQNQLSFDLIDADRVEEFAKLAASKRQLRLKKTGGAKETLAQLDLFDENALTNAAVLLFSDASKRVARGAEVNCQHYAGTEALRPSLSHKVFGGSVFDQADAAVEDEDVNPIEVYLSLLARLGRTAEAIDETARLLPPGKRASDLAPSLQELAQSSGDYERLMKVCRERNDLLGFAAGLLSK